MGKVAVLCESSGTVRDAFIRNGHNAISCDLLPSDSPGPHIQDDCMKYDWSGFDLLVCHPTCTYLCNSGVRWLHGNEDRCLKMHDGARFFKQMLDLPCSRIAVENPIMHGYALEIVGKLASQFVQPWMFGHGETKATGFWLKNLPLLIPTNVVEGRDQRIHKMPPSSNRWKERSKTFPGIAEAMATQWGSLL